MAVKLEPKNTKHYDRRAQVYSEQGKYDLADADYQQMVTLDPGDVMGYMGIVVRNQKAPLLLGQSVLGRLGKIEIDNPGMKLVITHKISK